MSRRRRMHADEVGIDADLVRRLVTEQFPRWGGLPVEPVPSAGTDNALYRLGEDMVVRLPRIPGAVEARDKEHTWLPRLAPLLPAAIPTPLAQGTPADEYPWTWSVYRWLKGKNPVVGSLADPTLLATELAQFVRALQRVRTKQGPRAGRGEPLTTRDGETRDAVQALRRTVDTGAVTAAWESALEAPRWSGAPLWIHGDLSPGNILVVGGRLSAVIDFGGMGVGDPACDLIVAWNLLPTEARGAFRAAVGVDEATWQRGRGWALSIALIQLPYYKDTNPPLAENARHVIHQVLADTL